MEELVTPAEKIFCFYKLGLEGSFMTSLINTIFKGDMFERQKLAMGYPELVEVCYNYNNTPKYWSDLMYRWNKSNTDGHLTIFN
jgi:hypothetical protein